ncbi:phosphotransferase family protein [Streptomyces sp. NBC_01465]|uniref:phosphotransferase family protein n=1 Tax=Streptomyces sp. NBC_01465 TaxID=2903878 RepID=UPI002E2F1827|nr:phosphotransferase [Streptomyces sp. NBC_01465]
MSGPGVDRVRLAGLLSSVFGGRRGLDAVTRLRGGSKKGVYRLGFDDGFSAILYVWSAGENYWPERDAEPEPFADGTGADLFGAAHRTLDELGVRVPELYVLDRSRSVYPEDVALVEDVRGGSLEALLKTDPAGGRQALDRLGSALRVMHGHTAPRAGKVALVERGESVPADSCEQAVTDRALRHIAEIAVRDERGARARTRLDDAVRTRAAAVEPRSEYRLIHGELGPDHVLVGPDGELVVIDIEGLMYFDVEWEHVFLAHRFKGGYEPLRVPGLDDARLRLYTLANHLSLVAGPLRLLDGDFPDREAMAGIAEHNLAMVLALVSAPG